MSQPETPVFWSKSDIVGAFIEIETILKPKDRFETTEEFKIRSNSFISQMIKSRSKSNYISIEAFNAIATMAFDYNADNKSIPIYSSALGVLSLDYDSKELRRYVDSSNFRFPIEIIEQEVRSIMFEYKDNGSFRDIFVYLDPKLAKDNWSNIKILMAGNLYEPFFTFEKHTITPSIDYRYKTYKTDVKVYFEPKIFEIRKSSNSDLIGIVKINKCSRYSSVYFTTDPCEPL